MVKGKNTTKDPAQLWPQPKKPHHQDTKTPRKENGGSISEITGALRSRGSKQIVFHDDLPAASASRRFAAWPAISGLGSLISLEPLGVLVSWWFSFQQFAKLSNRISAQENKKLKISSTKGTKKSLPGPNREWEPKQLRACLLRKSLKNQKT